MDEAARIAPLREPRILRWISTLEIAIACLALATIFVLVLVQVAQRYLPGGGWPWTGELARYSLAWLTFIMVGYLAGQGRHLAVEAVDALRWKGLVRAVRIFAHLAVAAIAVGFAIACYGLVTNDTGQVSPALGLPTIWLYVIPLIGFASTAVKSVAAAFLPDAAADNPAADDPAVREEPPADANDPEETR